MRLCPRGCDAFMAYVGIEDGYGMNGQLMCDVWECPACGEQEVGSCVDDSLMNFIEGEDLDNGGKTEE